VSDTELLKRVKDRIDYRLNDCLCEMQPDYDDSITGFNEAWDIVTAVLREEIARVSGSQTENILANSAPNTANAGNEINGLQAPAIIAQKD
jgi:hypothetical protein